MFLIMSGAYVGQDLRAEFGMIPPAFLPLGNRRLFQHQIALVPKGKRIYLSIPQSYQVEAFDKQWLTAHDVELLALPDDLSLGESLMAALALTSQSFDTDLSILYGDTLLTPPTQKDVITIAQVDSGYNWATIDENNSQWLATEDSDLTSQSQVVSGFFNFSSPRTLIRCLSQTHWNFLQALNVYHKTHGIQASQSHDWLDFGHVNTYYRSKAEYTTQRAFNELSITPDWIEKSSVKEHKIMAESLWFQRIPNTLKHFSPQFLGESTKNGKMAYRLEYLYHNALNELFVFARLPEMTWRQILLQMRTFLSACHSITAPENAVVDSLETLFASKTEQRLTQFCQERQFDWTHPWTYNQHTRLSLKALHEVSLQHLPTSQVATVMHGDFCFSNILYDFRKNRIKVIDPRGMTADNQPTIYGHIEYDIAKVCHSVIGLYDWIIAGYYRVDINKYTIEFSLADTDHLSAVQQLFLDTLCADYQLTPKALYAMQIQLFLSMLPLHSDDLSRQNALLANAFRLYNCMLEAK
ncbi:aminoglycoside phosphotransferase family protein [Vibrio metschnikovii]|uniref:aminoglycoside phosphotransferase family protein n=1 Tax=Vibrio metschnikovii TaxID=28172 RepID=UPI001C30E371|nr:aminoglycoside phosphotransferase family protein [Vibrio metschnikovii]